MREPSPRNELDDHLPPATDSREAVLRNLREALSGMRFGQVVVFVENSQVIRIEKLKKRRILTRRGSGPACSGRPCR